MATAHNYQEHSVTSSHRAHFNEFGIVTPDGSLPFVSPTGKVKAEIQFARLDDQHYAAEYPLFGQMLDECLIDADELEVQFGQMEEATEEHCLIASVSGGGIDDNTHLSL